MGAPSIAASSIIRCASHPAQERATSSSLGTLRISVSRVPSSTLASSQRTGRSGSSPLLHEYSSKVGISHSVTTLSITIPLSVKLSFAAPPLDNSIQFHQEPASQQNGLGQWVCSRHSQSCDPISVLAWPCNSLLIVRLFPGIRFRQS